MAKFLVPVDLDKNELQNAVIQNLATAPNSPKAGQEYYNTADNALYYYNGAEWVKGGKEYSGGTGITISGTTINHSNSTTAKTTQALYPITYDAQGHITGSGTAVTIPTVNNGTLTIQKNGATVQTFTANQSSNATANITVPTTATDVGAVAANTSITGATHTKITYDSKGLVTSGTDLSAGDIPNLTLAKITDVTASAAELNVLDGITATTTELNYTDGVTSNIQTQLNSKINQSDKGVANGVATLDANTKIPLTQLPDYILGQVLYGGNVTTGAVATLTPNAKTKLGTTSAIITLTNDTAAITGYVANNSIYYIADSDFTFAGIALLTGDWLISNGSAWTKIDNTDAVTGVKGEAESSYRIGNVNITKANDGLGNVNNTSDANKPISTATQTALNSKATLASPALTGTPTAPTPSTETNTTQIATTAFVKNSIGILNTTSNSSLPPSNNESFSNTINLNKIAKTGDYNDLLNRPIIQTDISLITTPQTNVVYLNNTGIHGYKDNTLYYWYLPNQVFMKYVRHFVILGLFTIISGMIIRRASFDLTLMSMAILALKIPLGCIIFIILNGIIYQTNLIYRGVLALMMDFGCCLLGRRSRFS